MRAALLTVFLVGCAAPTGSREYHQSAFPTAPPFNPAMDAPHTVGHPGFVTEPEQLPHGADRRVLPQTPETMREPGIWASDSEPKAAAGAQIGGVPFPPPEAPDAILIPSCVGEVDRLLNEPRAKGRFDNLIKPVQRCVVAEIYAGCVEAFEEDAAREMNKNRRRYSLPPLVGEPRTLTDAKRIQTALCKDTPRGPDSHGLARDVSNTIARSIGAGR